MSSATGALAQDIRQPRTPLTSPQGDVTETLKQVDALYDARDTEGSADQSLTLLREAAKKNPDNGDVQWRIARSTFWLAEDPANKNRQRELTVEGRKAGERAVKLSPDKAESHYYLAINLGEYGHAVGIVRALGEGVEGRFKTALDKARELNPRVDDGGIFSTYGRYWYELPWPRKNLNNSIKELRNGLKEVPPHLRMRVYLAETLLERKETGDVEEAQGLIKEVVAAKPGAYDRADEKRAQQMARRVAEKHNIKL